MVGKDGSIIEKLKKMLEEWLRGLDGMDRLVDDYVGDKIPLWEKIEYYGAAEPPVRCGESHLSGLTEPPQFVY